MLNKPAIREVWRRTLLRLPLIGLGALTALYGLALGVGHVQLKRADRAAFEGAVNQAHQRLESSLGQASQQLRRMATESSAKPAAADSNLLQAARQSSGLFEEITLYDTFGALQASSSSQPVAVPGFSRLLETALEGQTAVSLPFAGAESFPSVLLMVPVLDDVGQAQAVLAGTVRLDEVWGQMTLDELRKRGSIALLDAYGRILTHPNDPLAAFASGDAVASAGQALSGEGRLGEDQFFFLSRPLTLGPDRAGADWTVLALRPYRVMGSWMNRYTALHAVLGAVVLLLMALMAFALIQRVQAPIERALLAAEKVNRGQLDVQVPEDGPAEIAEIASALNHMTAEVRYHRHTMTSMVEARTRSLERAQKAQERIMEQLRASYDSTDEGFLVVDILSGEVLQFNKRVSVLFGIDDQDLKALSGDGLRETLKTMFAEPIDFENRWNYYNENPEEEGREEWQLKRPRPMTLSVYSAPVRSDQKNIIMARLWMFRDVTDQHVQEEQLRQSQQMEAMSHIAGSVAHDFNNLLTVVIGNLSLAQMECEPDSALVEYLDAAQLATGEATELIKQLQGFSNRSRMQLEAANLNTLVERACQTVRKSMQQGIRVHTDVDQELWDAAADPEQMQQAFTSLLMDRVDALSNGGDLWIRSANLVLTRENPRLPEERAPGEYVQIRFSRWKDAREEDAQERLFEAVRNRIRSRVALGLSMAYGIVVKHGGWIASLEKDAQRVGFAVYVPRAEQRSANMTSEARSDTPTPSEGIVLIVDDESGVRRIAVSVLKRAGLATREAADGEEAIRIFDELGSEIGIVLLDLSMPKLSGRETLKALKQADPKLPVLLCSGYAVAPEDFEKETGFRPDGVVTKPFDIRSLADQVRAAMQRTSLAENAG